MKPNGHDHAVLLSMPTWADVQLARTLLAGVGIPCMQRASNIAPLESGIEGSIVFQPDDLLVPTELLEQAKAVLAEAWDDFQADSPD